MIWPFISFFFFLVAVEVFINLRVNKLQHAIRALILANTKTYEQGEEIFKKYQNTGFKDLIKPTTNEDPTYLHAALLQRRRAMGLRVVLFVIAIVSIGVWIALV
ncbi:MAG: hypothetical protein JXQ87_15295 [Bacteroidia bacterium]